MSDQFHRTAAEPYLAMKVERMSYRTWPVAYRCSFKEIELIVVTSVGPRIVSLRWRGSANLLYEDTSNVGLGNWKLYGGHRFTIAPESASSYFPDNAACLVDTEPAAIRITVPLGPLGLRRVLIIRPTSDSVGLELEHVLENHGASRWRGALWAITCVPHDAAVIAPCAQSRLRFWPGTNESPFRVEPGRVIVTPGSTRGKAGWHSAAACLASMQREAILLIESPEPPAATECVDDGCNVEVFVCAQYAELETLSGLVTLAPGENARHRQHWRLLAPGVTPFEQPEMGVPSGRLPLPTMTPHAT